MEQYVAQHEYTRYKMKGLLDKLALLFCKV